MFLGLKYEHRFSVGLFCLITSACTLFIGLQAILGAKSQLGNFCTDSMVINLVTHNLLLLDLVHMHQNDLFSNAVVHIPAL